MPTLPNRPCLEPRCHHLRPCPVHGIPSDRYGKLHRQWREDVLSRARYKCRHCGSSEGLEADHIIPVAQGGERFDVKNGQALCKGCHSRKTREEQKGLIGR